MDSRNLNLGKTILISGASSSGKSEFAEMLAIKSNKLVSYIATAKEDLTDREWQAKIRKHQQRRPAHWKTLAISLELASYIEKATDNECLLIDSLGTWIANFLELDCQQWQAMSDCLIASLQVTQGKIILVGEETGWGVIPAYASGRLFRDRLGLLSRKISNVVDTTYLVVAGYALDLSLLGEPLSKYEI